MCIVDFGIQELSWDVVCMDVAFFVALVLCTLHAIKNKRLGLFAAFVSSGVMLESIVVMVCGHFLVQHPVSSLLPLLPDPPRSTPSALSP
jgi:hypothetical protein